MNRIPSGVVQFFEPLSSIRRSTENKILGLFKSKGYQEVVTPTFVYEDSVSEFLFEPLKNKLFKIVDKSSGQTMILRADITLQITQAVLLGDFSMPMRVCYSQNVYRDIKEHLGQKREFKQTGVELFGIKEIDADEEVIDLAINAMKLLGIKEFYVKIADTYIVEELIDRYQLDRSNSDLLRRLVFSKNFSAIEKGGFPKELVGEIESLITKSGIVETEKSINFEAFKLAFKIKEQHPDVKVFCDLFYCEYPIYHHGITFDILVGGKRLAVGGRYGNITKKLGKYIPATGFAINLDELVEFLVERSMNQ